MTNAIADFARVCEEAVKAAGAVLVEMIGRVRVREKSRCDLVTEADLASQEVVQRTIRSAFPEHAVIGEESDPGANKPGDLRQPPPYCWFVDPLDGTTNYVHQVPHYCVSLALERLGELLVAAVYDPAADECFTAAAGQGALLNGKPIHTSGVETLPWALAAVGFPAVVTPESPDLRAFLAAVYRCQAIRRTGSAALNLCYVAAGRFDAVWCFSTKAWDVAAGALIIRESGGIVTSPDGTPFVLQRGRLLATATQPLHAELVSMMAEAGLA